MKKPLNLFVAILACLTLSILSSGIILSEISLDSIPIYSIVSMEEKYANTDNEGYSPISLDDIYIPSNIPQNTFGLKIYNGSSWQPSEIVENNPFDYSKPTVIYTHGMGTGNGIDNPDIWFSKGYNVCHFLWGAFSDDLPTSGQDKVWAKGKYPNSEKNILSYTDAPWTSGAITRYLTDVPDHSITEIYAAYYLDLIMRENYNGKEIRFFGHSLGAHLSMSLTNYLMFCVEKREIPPSVLPDRVTMLDPYISDFVSNLNCSWSGESMKEGSSKKALETSLKARDFGIAFEELRTSQYVGIAAYAMFMASDPTANPDDSDYGLFKKIIMYSYVNTNFLADKLPYISAVERMHSISEYWYAEMMNHDYLYEQDSLSYGMAPFSEKEYVYSRMGNKYEISFSETEYDTSDDSVVSDITRAKVSGFIFEDKNNNGIFDERLKSQLLGVKISLMDENNNELVSQTTDLNGYYSFDLELGKKYKLNIIEDSNYKLGVFSSELFEALENKELLILNLPMIKNLS